MLGLIEILVVVVAAVAVEALTVEAQVEFPVVVAVDQDRVPKMVAEKLEEMELEARCEYGLGKCQWSGFIRASSR